MTYSKTLSTHRPSAISTWFLLILTLVFGLHTGSSAAWATEEKKVLCSTYPIYQLTRQLTAGRDQVQLELMLPSHLGCPHDYALTPQDMMKLAKADILVINGLGMEEFLGAPLKSANPNLILIDSSKGISETLPYGDAPLGSDVKISKNDDQDLTYAEDVPYEWIGAFDLKAGIYRWSFAKKNGKYADPSMKMLILASNSKHPIQGKSDSAKTAFQGPAQKLPDGGTLSLAKLQKLQFDISQKASTYLIKIDQPGKYVFCCEHFPYEFEADEHFFKDSDGNDVEPIDENPKGGHHHHHHGPNPHLFASPRMAAQLVENIAEGLSKADPSGRQEYMARTQSFTKKLELLADDMARLGKRLKNKRIVQPHGIFNYLSRDMGLEIVATVRAHGDEPSASEMIELVKVIREKKPGAIFLEPQYPEKAGRLLARETGILVDTLDPVASGPEPSSLNHYEKVMRRNMEVMQKVLGAN